MFCCCWFWSWCWWWTQNTLSRMSSGKLPAFFSLFVPTLSVLLFLLFPSGTEYSASAVWPLLADTQCLLTLHSGALFPSPLSLLFISFERGCASIVSCSSSSALRSLSLLSLSHSCSSWNTSAASTLPLLLLLSCLSCTRCFADYCCCVGWLAGRQSQSVVVVFAVVVVAADSLTAQTHSLTRNWTVLNWTQQNPNRPDQTPRVLQWCVCAFAAKKLTHSLTQWPSPRWLSVCRHSAFYSLPFSHECSVLCPSLIITVL